MNRHSTGTLRELVATDGEHRAIVIGAGIGGLLAARVLADHFQQVVVLDRDTLPDSAVHRRSIPQGQHVHALLAHGRVIIERLFPGVSEDLACDGAIVASTKSDLRWFQHGGYFAEPRRGLTVLLQSRPLLEHHIRRRVSALPNVTIVDGCQVTGLLASTDSRCVTGVRLTERLDLTTEHELTAHLTIDASGRGSRLPEWLEALGYAPPHQVTAGVASRYATRTFRRMPAQAGISLATVIVASPELRRGGVMLAQEGGRWIVSLSSRDGSEPPLELEAFIEWAKSLETPEIFDVVREATPLDDGVAYRFPRSTRWHYERMDRFPDGVLPFGDAICAFNPVYAQGMSIAAIEAENLASCLQSGTADLGSRFFAQVAAPIEIAWSMAAGGDLRYADEPAELPVAARKVSAYMARLFEAAQRDPVVAEAFHRVSNLVDPPTTLRHPGIAIRVMFASRRGTADKRRARKHTSEIATRRAA